MYGGEFWDGGGLGFSEEEKTTDLPTAGRDTEFTELHGECLNPAYGRQALIYLILMIKLIKNPKPLDKGL